MLHLFLLRSRLFQAESPLAPAGDSQENIADGVGVSWPLVAHRFFATHQVSMLNDLYTFLIRAFLHDVARVLSLVRPCRESRPPPA